MKQFNSIRLVVMVWAMVVSMWDNMVLSLQKVHLDEKGEAATWVNYTLGILFGLIVAAVVATLLWLNWDSVETTVSNAFTDAVDTISN